MLRVSFHALLIKLGSSINDANIPNISWMLACLDLGKFMPLLCRHNRNSL